MRLTDTTNIPSDDTDDDSQADENFGTGEKKATPAADFPATDLERARLFAEELDGNARFVPEWGDWFVWTDTDWKRDKAEVYERIYDLVDGLKERAYEIEDPKEQAATVKQAQIAGSQKSIDAVRNLCGNMRDIRVSTEFFDADPMIIGVANGCVDLRTGEFRGVTKEDFIMKHAGAIYDPKATCPQWEAFLDEILPHKELVSFIQRAIGYSLTGLTKEQVLFFLYGGGQNGKSTFVQTILALMNNYGWKTSAALFLASKNDDNNSLNMLSALPETRFVVGAEVESGARLAESRIKDLTGGDTLNARKLFHEAFTFTPTHKLWLYGNYKPTIRGTDEGIWRRMCLVPFEVQVPDSKKDVHLSEKLALELPGILNWAIKGCLDWQATGLQVPQIVTDAVKEYREEEDTIGEFVKEQCEMGTDTSKDQYRILRKTLYRAYTLWCEDEGYAYPSGPKQFAARVRKTGAHDGDDNTAAKRMWRGIRLSDPKSFVER